MFVGLILFVATVILVAMNAIEVNQLHAVASSQRSKDFFNPNGRIVIATVVAMASGLLLGLGIAGSIAGRRNQVQS